MFKKVLLGVIIFVITSFALLVVIPMDYFSLPEGEDYSFEQRENYSGLGVYVINLDKSTGRYIAIKPLIEQLGYGHKRVSAIYGADMTQEEIDALVDHRKFSMFEGRDIRPGEVGCYLSHMKVWKEFLDSGQEYALIFEDDVSFEPEKLKAVVDELQHKPSLWDLVLFNLSEKLNKKKRGKQEIATLVNDQKLIMYYSPLINAGGYIINRYAAQKLLQKALPITMPVDIYFNRTWELEIKFAGVENPILVNQTYGDSSIGLREKDPVGIKRYIIGNIEKRRSNFARYIYNKKLYFSVYSKEN